MSCRLLWLAVLALPIASAGCASSAPPSSRPRPRPLGASVAPGLLGRKAGSSIGVAEVAPVAGELTLAQAVSHALMHSPELASFSLSVRQAEATALQAGLRPNPELEFEIEKFAGTGALAGIDAVVATAGIGQLIELGAKRVKRRRLADLEAQLAGWDYEAARIGVMVSAAVAFTEVVAAQEQVRLAGEDLTLAEATREVVASRVKAGKTAPVETTRADVEVSTGRIRLDRAKRDLESARYALAATWGATRPGFGRAAGILEPGGQVPPFEALVPLLAQNPRLARWDTEFEQRQASLTLEEAHAIPNLEVTVGVRHVNEIDEQAAVLELAIPLPFFDRNQGSISVARHGVAKAREELRQEQAALAIGLQAAYQSLAAAQREGELLRQEVLPAAELAFEAMRKAFQQGKGDYLGVLDAQRTLVGARKQYLSALAAQAQATSQVEGLIGQSMTTLTGPGPAKKETRDVE